jgi:oxygen-independent coproporphyrinogen-3 oxidase
VTLSISGEVVSRVADALAGVPTAAYWSPVIYPWAVQNFRPLPNVERPRPSAAGTRIYAHIPFCRYHCTFCIYAVRGGAKRAEMERYVAGITRELEAIEMGTPLTRLTVGGGTPTALPPELLDEFLSHVFARTSVPERHNYKMEASPDSISEAHVQVMRKFGIGRVSIGVESMDEQVLDAVRRRHSPEQALEAIRLVTDHGIAINADLIYGLPGQTEASFRSDLEKLVEAGVTRVCLYALRLNAKTKVAKQLAVAERLDLERTLRWRSFVTDVARELGFRQEHPFSFERGGAAAALAGDRVTGDAPAPISEYGIGMSARSQLGHAAYRNHENFGAYLERVERGESPVESVFELSDRHRKTQLLATTLADGKPLSRAVYEHAFGAPIEQDFPELLPRLVRADLIVDSSDSLTLTDLGKLVYDRVLLCFYSEQEQRVLHTLNAQIPAAASP